MAKIEYLYKTTEFQRKKIIRLKKSKSSKWIRMASTCAVNIEFSFDGSTFNENTLMFEPDMETDLRLAIRAVRICKIKRNDSKEYFKLYAEY